MGIRTDFWKKPNMRSANWIINIFIAMSTLNTAILIYYNDYETAILNFINLLLQIIIKLSIRKRIKEIKQNEKPK